MGLRATDKPPSPHCIGTISPPNYGPQCAPFSGSCSKASLCPTLRRAILHVAPPRHVAAAAPRYAPRHSALATRNSEREGGPAPPLHHEPRPARTAGVLGSEAAGSARAGARSLAARASGRLFSPGTTARAHSRFVIRVITSPAILRWPRGAIDATDVPATVTLTPLWRPSRISRPLPTSAGAAARWRAGSCQQCTQLLSMDALRWPLRRA